MYGEAQLFKREPMSAERKETLLKRTAEELSKDGYGKEKLKKIGFTSDEIEELLPRQGQIKKPEKVTEKKNEEEITNSGIRVR